MVAELVNNALVKSNTENRKHNQFLSDKMESISEKSLAQGLLTPKEEPPEFKSNTKNSPITIISKSQQPSSSITATNHEIALPNNSKSPIGIRNSTFMTPQQQQTLSTTFLQHRFHNDTVNNNNNFRNNSNSRNPCEGLQLPLSNNLITPTPDKNTVLMPQSSSNMTTATNVKAETNEATANSLNNNMVPSHALSAIYQNQTELGIPAISNISTNSVNNAGSRPAVRRRVRRKANSMPDDQTEQLTEMSVRGLNLFRYASISEGIYQCTECAKDNIQKTFKNKYSFQRHAFLYHEGTQRKVFPCPVCGKEFSRPDKMKNHMKTTHECYMPRDCTYPLNILINTSSGSKSTELIKIPKIEFMSTTQ